MNDHPEQDPRLTFQKDQAEAQAQEQDRDQTSWELNVRNGEAAATVTEAHAVLDLSRAKLLQSISALIGALTLAVVIVGLAFSASLIIGAFQ